MYDAEAVRKILDKIRGVWEPAILAVLADGPVRSGTLRRRVSSDLDWRTFVDAVTRLEDKGLLTRTTFPEGTKATKVWYELTPAGQAVLELLAEVENWAEAHRQDLPGLLPPPDPTEPDLHPQRSPPRERDT